jgi:hypothetical protein
MSVLELRCLTLFRAGGRIQVDRELSPCKDVVQEKRGGASVASANLKGSKIRIRSRLALPSISMCCTPISTSLILLLFMIELQQSRMASPNQRASARTSIWMRTPVATAQLSPVPCRLQRGQPPLDSIWASSSGPLSHIGQGRRTKPQKQKQLRHG